MMFVNGQTQVPTFHQTLVSTIDQRPATVIDPTSRQTMERQKKRSLSFNRKEWLAGEPMGRLAHFIIICYLYILLKRMFFLGYLKKKNETETFHFLPETTFWLWFFSSGFQGFSKKRRNQIDILVQNIEKINLKNYHHNFENIYWYS